MEKTKPERIAFTSYQIFIVTILAILQFTIVLDFMVLSPLGAILLKELNIQTSQFGLVVSAYAFSAGASGLLAAGFADKFDRKKLLLFFYCGFMLGTLFCANAPTYNLLLLARIVTGIFGGVVSSITFAIVTDLFALEIRGRVMGFVQMAFGASQVLGIPIGLELAIRYGWHSPFWMIAGVGTIIGIVIVIYMKPVNAHLAIKSERNPFQHLVKTLSKARYLRAFLATTLLSTGGFMLMPFGSAYSNQNLGIKISQLPTLYVITGIFAFVTGPITGMLSDRIGKYRLFAIGTLISIVIVAIYTNLGITPFWQCVLLNVILIMGISSRMISSSALISAIPEPQDRGAFMSISSSVQQVSGGAAAALAGVIITQSASGKLEHYPTLGLIVIASMLIALVLMYSLDKYVKKKAVAQAP